MSQEELTQFVTRAEAELRKAHQSNDLDAALEYRRRAQWYFDHVRNAAPKG